MADGFAEFPIFLISFVAGAAVVVSLFISKLVRRVSISRVSITDAHEQTKIAESLSNVSKKSSHQSHINKSNKKKHGDKRGRDAKQSFNHQWLLTSLKGHSSSILDMEFSPNGKYLATCGEGAMNPSVRHVGRVAIALSPTRKSLNRKSLSTKHMKEMPPKNGGKRNLLGVEKIAEETDEPDPGGGDGSGNSSGSEGNKENAIAPKVLLSRRQKKNRVRKEDGSPVSKKMTRKTSKRSDGCNSKRYSSSSGSRQHFKLNLNDSELYVILRNYVLTPDQMMGLGYPIESSLYPGRAIIYKSSSPRDSIEQCQIPRPPHLFDVNAREFVPSCDAIPIISKRKSYSEMIGDWNMDHSQERKGSSDTLESSESTGSKSSDKSDEDRSGDSDLGEDKDSDKDISQTEQIIQRILKRYQPGSDEKKCVRCGRGFFVMLDGEYLTQEKCVYHWGKLQRVFGTNPHGVVSVKSEFSCCKGKKNSKGCSTAKLHVWTGVAVGVNGPLDGYVKTKPRKTSPPEGNYGVYSMDCEMCYTTQGLELAKITIVATDGRTVYDSYVKPENTIIDYNTRFSGITAKDLKRGNAAKNLKDVQNDLMGFINADTILIGHGLENDLKALKMIHSTVIDTSVTFPHYYGLPYKRSLRSLVSSFLKRDIQSCGHDSFEDARACMELMLWRVKKDFKNNFDHKNHKLIAKF